MIISASRRTDIPAFYAEWFINRIREGFCEVPNPFNPSQISRVSLLPQDVDAIVFWTRNPAALIDSLGELDARGYAYYFHVTLLDYPAAFEPGLPPLSVRIDSFRRLADRVGPDRVLWRYDPLIFTENTGTNYHEKTYTSLAAALSPYTRRCTISILDEYNGIRPRLEELARAGYPLLHREPGDPEVVELLRRINGIAGVYGISLRACTHSQEILSAGISRGKCIDDELLLRLFGIHVPEKKDPGQRTGCLCVRSRDIGIYNSCLFGCRYCYATKDFRRAALNRRRHDPRSPSLL